MKSEKEKMLQGLPYKAFGTELLKERQVAKEKVFSFNNTRPTDIETRNKIINSLLGKTKGSFFIEPPFRCDYGYNISIGKNFYANYNLVILDCAKVTIGDNVLMGPNVSISTAGHPIHFKKRNEEWEYAFPITIENNVWLGSNVVINPGVTIGENSVIGSGSVLTKNIPSNVIAVGNPCKVKREITEDDRLYYYKKISSKLSFKSVYS